MSELETAGKIADKAGEAFDKIEDEEKKEGFLSLIEQAKENGAIKWCKEQWNKLTEDQKMKLYNRGEFSIWNKYVKNHPIIQLPRSYIEGAKNTIKHGGKNAARFKFLEEIPTRLFVEFGIFDKPEGLTDEQLCKNIKSDAKNFDLYLLTCETVCTVIPDAQAAVPIIKGFRTYTKWYKKNGTEAIIAKVNETKENEIKENTSKELAGIIGGGETKQAA